MSNNVTNPSGGIAFVDLLAILFIALKLTGYVDWSWWFVLSPLFVGPGILLICFALIVIFKLTIK